MRFFYALPFLLACSSNDGALVLSMSTDLLVPADVNSVGLYVQQIESDGTVRDQWKFAATPLFDPARQAYVVHFPATLVLQSRGDGSDRVRARAVAFTGDSVPLVVREARVNVPTQGAVVLKLPLLWLNAGTAGDTRPGIAIDDSADFDAMTRFTTGCPPEQTRGDEGTCVGIDVPLDSLPLATDDAKPSACVDPASVFAPGADLVRLALPTDGTCTLELGRTFDLAKTNVGVLGTSGYAAGAELVRPLGSHAYAIAGTTLTLGAGACTKLARAKALVVSPRSKTLDDQTICAPWQTEVEPEPSEPGVPVEAGAPEADANANDASTGDAEATDAADAAVVPVDWTLGTTFSTASVGAHGIYVTYTDNLVRYPLEPGAATKTVANAQGLTLVSLGDNAGTEVLLGRSADALYRVAPDTLLGTPVALCAADCPLDGSYAQLVAGPVRGGDDRIYVVVTIPQVDTAPYYNVYSTALDGSDGRLVGTNLVGVMGGEAASFLVSQPAGVAFRKTVLPDSDNVYDCSGSSCSVGSSFTGVSFYRFGGMSSFSPLVGSTFFAIGGWETVTGPNEYGSASGVLRVDGRTMTVVAPTPTGTTSNVIRRGEVACWRSDAIVQCIDAAVAGAGPATLPGMDASGQLTADATYIYWTDAAHGVLHRRAWARKETAD